MKVLNSISALICILFALILARQGWIGSAIFCFIGFLINIIALNKQK